MGVYFDFYKYDMLSGDSNVNLPNLPPLNSSNKILDVRFTSILFVWSLNLPRLKLRGSKDS